jgi:hypothetical protein
MVTAHDRAPHWTPARGLARPQPPSPCGLYLPLFRPARAAVVTPGPSWHKVITPMISFLV